MRRPQLDLRASPGFKSWEQYARTLEARLRAYTSALDVYLQTLESRQTPTTSVIHKVITNATTDGRVLVDFRQAQKYTLILAANAAEVVFVPPTLDAGRAASAQLEIEQAGTGSKTITAWTNVVFYATDSAYMSGGLPVLSTNVGYVDVVAFSYNQYDSTLRGMYTKGATA